MVLVTTRAVNVFDISLCRNLSFHPESGTLPEGHARLKGEKSRSVSQLVAVAGKWRQRSDVAPRVIVPGGRHRYGFSERRLHFPAASSSSHDETISSPFLSLLRLHRFQSSCLSFRLYALAAKNTREIVVVLSTKLSSYPTNP